MSLDNPTARETEELIRRREYESHILNSRTNIILTLNGLGAVAVAAGTALPPLIRLWIAFLMLVINGLWIWCASGASGYGRDLSAKIAESHWQPLSEQLHRMRFPKCKFRVRPTSILGSWIPVLLSVGWIVGILLMTYLQQPPAK